MLSTAQKEFKTKSHLKNSTALIVRNKDRVKCAGSTTRSTFFMLAKTIS